RGFLLCRTGCAQRSALKESKSTNFIRPRVSEDVEVDNGSGYATSDNQLNEKSEAIGRKTSIGFGCCCGCCTQLEILRGQGNSGAGRDQRERNSVQQHVPPTPRIRSRANRHGRKSVIEINKFISIVSKFMSLRSTLNQGGLSSFASLVLASIGVCQRARGDIFSRAVLWTYGRREDDALRRCLGVAYALVIPVVLFRDAARLLLRRRAQIVSDCLRVQNFRIPAFLMDSRARDSEGVSPWGAPSLFCHDEGPGLDEIMYRLLTVNFDKISQHTVNCSGTYSTFHGVYLRVLIQHDQGTEVVNQEYLQLLTSRTQGP
ncbi:hypothetical protein Tco_0989815, partial [Tanacetum coccineum]